MSRKLLTWSLAAVLCFTTAVHAQENRASITRTSPNHTEIVIHDYSPEARRAQVEQAERARRKLELKQQRAHEIRLAEIQAGSRQGNDYAEDRPRRRRQNSRDDILPSIAERQRAQAYRPAPFFNGGRYTGFSYGGFLGFGGFSPGFGGFGFTPRYGYGYRAPVCRPRYRGPVYQPRHRICR